MGDSFDLTGLPLCEKLNGNGQSHLFAVTSGEEDKSEQEWRQGFEKLEKQLAGLDAAYPGGLLAYTDRARELLGKSKRGENPFDGFANVGIPSPMHRFAFEDFGDRGSQVAKAETAGAEAFAQGKVACVLVAGGLGERLGFSGIKVALPCEITSGTSFLKLYCEHIKALGKGNDAGKQSTVPFAIMTSDDTHKMTADLLEQENFFGLSKEMVRLIKQEKVASLSDNDARLTIDPNDRFSVLCKPHGHGDVHLLLHQSGIAREWSDAGIEWVVFFQDTNPMSFRTMPAALGISLKEDLQMNSIAIPRKAKAAAGAIMRLESSSSAAVAADNDTSNDHGSVTINVEYNYIDGLLRDKYQPQGDVNDETGYSPFPGNMNQLVFKLLPYVSTLEQTGGIIPEFVNPKYSDGEVRSAFKPTRLECMMQDYPLTLKGDADAKIGVTLFHDAQWEHDSNNLTKPSLTHRLYAPAKNNLADAVKKAAQGVPDASCTSTELAIYACNSLLLKRIGCNVQGPLGKNLGGVEQPEWPHIVFLPSFLPTLSCLGKRFLNPELVHISNRSTLVVQGDVVFQGDFRLDGALEIVAAPGAKVVVRGVNVHNAGESFTRVEPDDDSEPEIYRIRGFKLDTQGQRCVRHFLEAGTFDAEIIQEQEGDN